MKVIHKYGIAGINKVVTIKASCDMEPMDFQVQAGPTNGNSQAVLWALVDQTVPAGDHRFLVVGTGIDMDGIEGVAGGRWEYVGTAQFEDIVLHLFHDVSSVRSVGALEAHHEDLVDATTYAMGGAQVIGVDPGVSHPAITMTTGIEFTHEEMKELPTDKKDGGLGEPIISSAIFKED